MLTLMSTSFGQDGPVQIRTWLSLPLAALTVHAPDSVVWATMSLTPFKEYLAHVVRTQFPRRQDVIADAIGITTRHLRRVVSASGEYPLDVYHCLRLAAAARLN